MIEQLSVFLENSPGRLAEMARVLGDGGQQHARVRRRRHRGVRRRAHHRATVRTPRGALEAAGFGVTVTRGHRRGGARTRPGGLADVLDALGDARRQRRVRLLLRRARTATSRSTSSVWRTRTARARALDAAWDRRRGRRTTSTSGTLGAPPLRAGARDRRAASSARVEVLGRAEDARGRRTRPRAEQLAHALATRPAATSRAGLRRLRQDHDERPVVEPPDVVDQAHVVADVVAATARRSDALARGPEFRR